MGLLPRRVSVPDQEVAPTKIPYKNLSAVASNEDGVNLNFYYELRSSVEEANVYVKKREGITILSSVGAASTDVGRGIFSWRKSSETTDKLFYALDDTTDTKVYIDSSGTGSASRTLTGITGKDIYYVPVSAFDGSTTTEKLFVFTTGVTQIYDGSSWAAASSTPLQTASLGIFYRNMLVAVTTGNANRINFSDVGKPDTFTAGNAIDFPGAITGLHVFENSLLVFTRNSIYQVIGSQPNEIVVSGSTRGLLQKGVAAGTDSHRSIARVGDWVYFWNRDRVYRYNTNELQEVAFSRVQKTLGSVVKTPSNKFAGMNFNGRYYLAVVYSTGTSNNAVLVYDPRADDQGRPIDNWVLHTSPWVNSFATYRATTNANPQLVFDTNSATSRVEKAYTYNGSTTPVDNLAAASTSTITCQYTSQFLDHGDGHFIKKVRYIFFRTKGLGVSANATLKVATNFGGYATVLNWIMDAGGFVLDEGGTSGAGILDTTALTDANYSITDVKRLQLPDSRSVSVQFYDTQSQGQTEIYDFDLQLIPKKLKTK